MSQPTSELPDSHDFVELSEGLWHHRVDGPEGGPIILLIHGATWEFERIVPCCRSGFADRAADLGGAAQACFRY